MVNKQRSNKSSSMLARMLLPMLAVMIVQAGMFCGTIIFGGTISELTDSVINVLNERVINRKNYIQNEILQSRSKLDESVDFVNNSVEKSLMTNKKNYEDIVANSDLALDILDKMIDELVFILRKNGVTGAFIILNGQEDVVSLEGQHSYSGIHIKNMDPEYSAEDNSDLLLSRAPIEIAKNQGISMDTWWEPQFNFSEERGNADFYYMPYRAAIENPGVGWKDLCYWSLPHKLNRQDWSVISYSVPLINSAGKVYGVMGIELSLDYLQKMLPYSEINGEKCGAYVIGVDLDGKNTFQTVVSSGAAYKQLFGDGAPITLKSKAEEAQNYYLTTIHEPQNNIYSSLQYFNMYNNNTPFEKQKWALVGIVREDDLLETVNQVKSLVFFALLFSLTIGTISLYIVGSLSTHPITALVRRLRLSDPSRAVKLDKINITEIDELSGAIEELSLKVADSASKLSQIIEIADVNICAFEYLRHEESIQFSGALPRMLGIAPCEYNVIECHKFREIIENLENSIEEESEGGNVRIYCLQNECGQRWLRMKITNKSGSIMGVITDITQEMVEKRKIEYERDYDILTNLLNRRAFYAILNKRFEQPERLKIAALIMLDLDNLKYINDTYGHDYGDLYIRGAANVLNQMSASNRVASRISGDEFMMFLYGYETKNELRKIIEEIKQQLRLETLQLPDGEVFKIRASAGVSWYPDDTLNSEDLVRYADFAMYRVKNTTKGEFTEFDVVSYNRDSYLLHSREELNKLIDEKMVEYHFQPIVSVETGNIFAYEALMRSQMKTLKSPLEVLSLARSQSKLYQIERLTWFLAMEAYEKYRDEMKGCKIFLNSIASQELSPKDMESFKERFQPYLSNLVVELTEEEKQDENSTSRKQEFIHECNGGLALDDFGTGYNGEAVLLNLSPDFVKLDMSLVRNIHLDVSKRKLIQNLVSYAKMKNIKVIAEGIECMEEMEGVIALGVDYMQGFYLGLPSLVPKDIRAGIKDQILKIKYSQNR